MLCDVVSCTHCTHRGIEWLSHHSFVSWAHTSAASVSGQVRSEICVTDITTGKVTPLNRGDSENGSQTPIETVRVSSHKYICPTTYWLSICNTASALVSHAVTFSAYFSQGSRPLYLLVLGLVTLASLKNQQQLRLDFIEYHFPSLLLSFPMRLSLPLSSGQELPGGQTQRQTAGVLGCQEPDVHEGARVKPSYLQLRG